MVMMNCRQESEVQKTRMNIGCQIRIRVDSSGEKDQRALLNRQERVIIIRGSSKSQMCMGSTGHVRRLCRRAELPDDWRESADCSANEHRKTVPGPDCG